MKYVWGRAALAAAAVCGLSVYVGCQVATVARSRPAVEVTADRAAPSATPAPVVPSPTVVLGTAAPAAPATAPSIVPFAPSVASTRAAFPIPIVELRGPAADLGAGHGRQLGAQIKLLHATYLAKFIRSDFERLLALSAADAFRSRLTPEYRDEVAAMAGACGIDPRDAMLGQCFLDLTGMTACSTVTLPADAAPDGVARFGRNLDFPSLNVADKYTVLFVYRPAGRYGFVSVGWPGMVGVLSGMNEHGLAVANMEVTRGPRLPQAMPYTLLYRLILEQCRTTDEALALLARTPRQTANNLMIMDAAGDRAVAEIAPDGVTVRRPDPFALISTNHRRDQDNATPGRCGRYDYLRDASERHFGRIDVPRLEKMLATVSQGKRTLQSMVFEPSNRVIHLSAGADAARGTFHRLEVGAYFEK